MNNKPTTYGKLEAVQVFKDGENFISGDEFIKRAQALTNGTMNDEALAFYEKKENWHLLPDCEFLFFADTEFRSSGGDRFVWCLCRGGAEWERVCGWLGYGFGRHGRVAVLASSPSSSELSTSAVESLTSALPKKLTINGIVYKRV